ncbi:GH3 auxin-responsive promoter family protein [Planctomicrobium sp. SH664]|uniref:GH3 auxin-responsive promoter family protein n=1 Tax=Planctomicrobium sp. SH664 TaxID=3448125 RepID=UPI003F5B52B2
MLRQLRYYGGYAVRVPMRRKVRAFLHSIQDCQATQQATLQRIVQLNADSDFSRRHGLHPGISVEQFRRQIPVGDFEAVRNEVEQLKVGEASSLLGSRNKLLMFALSSGTTGDSKYIPITTEFLKDYRRGWNMWGISTFDDHPALHTLDILQLSSDYDLFRTPSGIPCGNISGLVSKMQSPLVRTMYTIPYNVAKIRDSYSKLYTALRLSLENVHVGLVMTANPSTLVQLAKMAIETQQELIRDIADGTLSSRMSIPDEVRAALGGSRFRPNRRRALDLEQLIAQHDQLLPRHFWPQLKLAAVWTGGSASAYLESMRRYYGDVCVRDHGLSASEGRMTIPFIDGTSNGVLDIGSHFFEFIPETEYGSARPNVLQAHELSEGHNYYILLTTVSGLYRYDIRDVVRCCGFRGTTPLLEFLHKGASISNVTGEKLTESQVVTAVNHALKRYSLELDYYTLSPVWGDPPAYHLHLEEAAIPASGLLAKLSQDIDEQLRGLNCEYQEKRQSGRLAPVKCQTVANGTWLRFIRHRQSRPGGSVEQYKHPCLVPALQFSETLCNDFGRGDVTAISRVA